MIIMKLMFSFHETALHICTKKENFDILKLLLSKKSIDINIKDSVLFVYYNQVIL